jgi:hypothetical protein
MRTLSQLLLLLRVAPLRLRLKKETCTKMNTAVPELTVLGGSRVALSEWSGARPCPATQLNVLTNSLSRLLQLLYHLLRSCGCLPEIHVQRCQVISTNLRVMAPFVR